MRWLLCLMFLGCDSDPAGPAPAPDVFESDGAPVDGGVKTDAGTDRQPLKLRFVPVPHDADTLRLTDIAFLPESDEFLLADKDGSIVHMRLEGDAAVRLGAFTIDDTWTDSDAGLISLAIDPGFAENRWFYAGVSVSRETNVVRRYTLHPGDLGTTKASETLVIEVTGSGSPRSWHNIGSIGFDDTGALWALFGDKVLDEMALDPESPLGSMLRVHPLPEGGYEPAPDNPYAEGGGHPAVFIKGLRSPWKGAHHRGVWFVGDVGLEDFEEINRIDTPGATFGWPDIEGPCDECEGHTAPWIHYGRGSGHPFVRDDPDARASNLRSAWVGWVYRPTPADPYRGRWNDVVTFGEAYVGYVRAARVDGSGDDSWHAGHLRFATGWSQGPDGHVYVTALGTWPVDAPVVPSPLLRAELDE